MTKLFMTEPLPKPISEVWRPELVRLPKMTRSRQAFRTFGHGLMKLIAKICLNVSSEEWKIFRMADL